MNRHEQLTALMWV